MGNQQSSSPQTEAPTVTPTAETDKKGPVLGKSGKKICCSCPDTKKLRDECVVQNGEEHCADVIEAHKACLRAEGFVVK